MNEYLIPHNFKNNGRIMNMFTKKAALKALICSAIVFLILKLIKVSLFTKAMIFASVGFPICLLALLEIDAFIINIIRFYKNRKVYYRYFTKKGEENARIKAFYEKQKR